MEQGELTIIKRNTINKEGTIYKSVKIKVSNKTTYTFMQVRGRHNYVAMLKNDSKLPAKEYIDFNQMQERIKRESVKSAILLADLELNYFKVC